MKTQWSENDSHTFLELGREFVPDREVQMEIICDLVPAGSGTMVELCCGEGLLSQALLRRFPAAAVHAFDGSPAMLERARALNPARFTATPFDLAGADWRSFPFQPDAVVSSLAVHHLDSGQKRALYRDMAAQLRPGGVLAIADVTQPASEAGSRIAAKAWAAAIRPEFRDVFERQRWNLYRYPDSEIDKPSGVFEQLEWLRDAGLKNIDVFYFRAGHAIFGGEK